MADTQVEIGSHAMIKVNTQRGKETSKMWTERHKADATGPKKDAAEMEATEEMSDYTHHDNDSAGTVKERACKREEG